MSAVVIDLNDVVPNHGGTQRYDLDLIVQRLRDSAETWVPRLFPKGKRVGDEWRLANIRGDAPRNTGSCVIALRGPHAGDWIDFDGNTGGGPINTIEEGTGLTGRDLIIEAADMTGVNAGAPARQAPVVTPAPKRDPAQEIANILSRAVPVADTSAATYLAGRSLTEPHQTDLLFHPDLTHWETKTGYAALLGQVRDRSGEVIGLHRTYLVTDGNAVRKAPIAKPKMMLGRIAGGAVRLAPIGKDGRVALCEGIETGLAVMTACPDLPVWATLSTSGLEQIDLPPAAQRVLILADHDASGAGLRAAEASARRLRAQGRDVAIAIPPEEGEDFNDMLLRAGSSVVAQLIAATEQEVDADAVLQIGQHRPLNYQGSGNDIPVLRADEGDLGRAVAQVWSVVMASNRTPWVFRFAGQPTWVVPDDEGRPVATILNEERLRHMLARLARCLTLCQAWIAAGKPRGSKTIGSYENWAQVIGGVLETAGIPGFLLNLEDMMVASDSEGAGWSAFIAAWWDRFGTAQVGSADLFDVAIACDPAPPMSGGTERAQKTAFGMSISRMRDRVFRLETRAVRVRKAGVLHKTTRWQLEICEADAAVKMPNQPEVGGPLASGGDLKNKGPHHQHAENNDKWGPWGPGGPILAPSHTRMRAHAHDRDDPGKGPQGPPGPQIDVKTEAYTWGPRWGPQSEGPPRPPRPDWLKELDP